MGEVGPGGATSAAGSGAMSTGASTGSGGSTMNQLDAGVGSPQPMSEPVPLEVGDLLDDETQTSAPVVFPPDAGLVADVEGVVVGDDQPASGQLPSVCLHIDLLEGSYRVVPDNDSPDERLEPVLSFGQSEQGFTLFSIYPWVVTFIVPAEAPTFVPTDSVSTVLVTQVESTPQESLRVRFQVQGDAVAILSVVVEAI